VVLVDFLGKPLSEFSTTYPFPTPEAVFPFLEKSVNAALANVPNAKQTLAGVGVAMPFRLWEWHQVVGAPADSMAAWRKVDVSASVRAITGFEPVIGNDATSACVAEHLLGKGLEYLDFVYLYVGAFIGGGVVLSGKVVNGRNGNAGAFGPLPVPDGKQGVTQLLNVASLHVLERRIRESGGDPEKLRDAKSDWREHGAVLEQWIADTARNLAIASAAAAAIIEIEAVLVDGAIPLWVKEKLVASMHRELGRLDMTGVEKPEIIAGEVGRPARSIGAALLPIHARYFVA
jgi:predicted NBD/HSP70 family sugar kinase